MNIIITNIVTVVQLCRVYEVWGAVCVKIKGLSLHNI